MPTFAYTAKDKKGARVEGTIDAEGRSAVVTRLQQMGYFPIKIEQTTKAAAAATKPAPAKPPASKASAPARPAVSNTRTTVARKPADVQKAAGGGGGSPSVQGQQKSLVQAWRSRRVTMGDVAALNRQLADLIGAGIPLVKALALIVRQIPNEKLQVIVMQILDDVQGGSTFADALGRHPQIFSKLYVAMVRSGEAGGMLDSVLERLADFSEQEEQLRGKIKSALAYPVVMILAGSVAIGVMFGFVIPKITATFSQLGQSLPAITVLLIKISDAVQNYWWAMGVALVVGVAGFWQYTSSGPGLAWWHSMQLRMPLMGTIVQKREVARFTRTLGSLLKNGVSILVALDIVREVVTNSVVRSEVDGVIDRITQGATLAEPMRQSRVFPPLAVNMISIGEETGRLPEVLLRVSESYETQVERTVRTLTSLIEPLIIVAMGVIVGFIVIAMLLPIFSLDPSGASR
jgi:type II secretory pathway component PulF